jgi:hypothetical protein
MESADAIGTSSRRKPMKKKAGLKVKSKVRSGGGVFPR